MRLSVTSDPLLASIARVRLDGADVTRDCFAADEEAGTVDCFERDDRGRYFVRDDHIARVRLRGLVVIDFPRGLD